MAQLTLTEILAEIDTRLPNIFTATQKVNWINMIARKYYKYAPREVNLEITLTSGVGSYVTSTSDGFRFENLNYLKFYNTTAAVASSDIPSYELYKKNALYEHGQAGQFIYESSGGALGIAPIPTTSGHRAVANYYKYPATLTTSDTTTFPDIKNAYEEILIFGAMQIMAKSGISPDIDIANNAQADLDELLSQARLELSRRNYKAKGRNRVSYKQGWGEGSGYVDYSS